jgi:uncharacterized protein YbcV (DUF1398 family)
MNDHNVITEILNESKKTNRPYPETFKALADAGVSYYRVQFGNGFVGTYIGTFGVIKEKDLEGFQPLSPALQFSKELLINAIRRTQQQKTSYIEFVGELAAAGITHYEVDMRNRSVTYYDRDENHSYQELVP